MDNTKVVKLSGGWRVRCRPVPPLASKGAMNRDEFWYPPPPTIKVKTAKGRSEETVDAPESSPEYQAYFKLCREIDQRQDRAGEMFYYDYGVVEWSDNGKAWLREPPKDWELDPLIAEQLPEDMLQGKPRVLFIMYGLIQTNQDLTAVGNVLYALDQRPLQEGEVQAAEDSFPGGIQGEDAEGMG